MSSRKSKFGHLFGEDGSSKDKDLLKDPLTSILAPPTTTTSTTSTSASRISTSSTTATGGASTPTGAKKTPPGSTSGSRSSSRLQNHALLSSLTQQRSSGSSSIFDSPLLSSDSSFTSSSSKRDFLFGESSSTGPSRRTSTPPLVKTSATTTIIPVSKTPSVSSISSSITGGINATAATTTARVTSPLEPEASPLGPFTGSRPASTEPISRPSSSASQSSQQSAKSGGRESAVSTTKATSQASNEADFSSPTSTRSTAAAPASTVYEAPSSSVDSPLGLPPPLSQPPKQITPRPSSKRLSSAPASKEQTPAQQRQPTPTMPAMAPPSISKKKSVVAASTTDAFIAPNNPLLSSSVPCASTPVLSSLGASPSSLSPSPSIHTFEALSRTRSNSPMISSSSASIFERDTEALDGVSSPGSSTPRSDMFRSTFATQALDNAAEAFANDNLFVPADPTFSDPVFDVTSSSSAMRSSTTLTRATTFSTTTTTIPPIPAVIPPTRKNTLSLDQGIRSSEEDDNPWDTQLAADLEQTRIGTSQAVRVDYGDPETGVSFFTERTTAAFTMPTVKAKQERKIFASLPEEEGIFGPSNVKAHQQQHHSATHKSHGGSRASTADARAPPPLPTGMEGFAADQALFSTTMSTASSLTGGQWNVAAAVEAASQDPDFLGGNSILSQSTAKILDIMQMPKDRLEKDVSAQEVFDNPWE